MYITLQNNCHGNLKIYNFFRFSLAYTQICPPKQIRFPVVRSGAEDAQGLAFICSFYLKTQRREGLTIW